MNYKILGMDMLLAEIDKVLNDKRPRLGEVLRYLGARNGKTLRGALTLAASGAGAGVSDRVLSVATVIELLHLATLVHDDVIDNAPLRRGRASIQKKFGKKHAVLAGDYLFTTCFRLLSTSGIKHLARFSKIASRVCEGELEEQQNLGNFELTTRQYLRIIRGKTAALFACSLFFGAAEAEASEDVARALARVGYNMGMFFQILDDCNDYESCESEAKKSVRHDLAQGVVTLPLICALKREPDIKKLLEENAAEAVVLRVIKSGGVDDARAVAKKYYEKAERYLSLLPDFKTKPEIAAIIKGVYEA